MPGSILNRGSSPSPLGLLPMTSRHSSQETEVREAGGLAEVGVPAWLRGSLCVPSLPPCCPGVAQDSLFCFHLHGSNILSGKDNKLAQAPSQLIPPPSFVLRPSVLEDKGQGWDQGCRAETAGHSLRAFPALPDNPPLLTSMQSSSAVPGMQIRVDWALLWQHRLLPHLVTSAL